MSRRAWLVLLGITACGAVLRLQGLQDPGLSGNEDYVAIAARAILSGGVPVFPSGVPYPRALPFSYAVALSVSALGWGEVALRLPAALCSAAIPPAAALLGRRLWSPSAGLVAAGLLAFSGWEVLVGRTARMYAPLSLAVLLGLVLTLRAAERRRAPLASGGAVLAHLLSAMLHQLAGTVAFLYAALAVVRWRDRRGRAVLAAAAVLLAAATAGEMAWERHAYSSWAVRAEGAPPPPPPPDEADREPDGRAWTERVLPLWSDLRRERPVAFAAVLAAAAALAALWTTRLLRGPDRALPGAALAATVAMAFGLAGVALAAAGTYLLATSRVARTAALLAGIAAACGAWVALAGGGAGATARDLLAWPPNFGIFFVLREPALAVLAALGAWFARSRPELVLLPVVPALAMGLHPAALERFYDRYAYFLQPYVALLAAVAVAEVARRLGRRGRVAWGLVLLVPAALHADQARRAASLRVGPNPGLQEAYGEPLFLPDHRGAALFVVRHARPGDRVVAMDALNQEAYRPGVDAQLTVARKSDAEGWLGGETLRTAGDLAAFLDARPGGRTWVVLSAPQVRRFGRKPEMAAIRALLEERGRVAWRGADGLSDVYLCATPRP